MKHGAISEPDDVRTVGQHQHDERYLMFPHTNLPCTHVHTEHEVHESPCRYCEYHTLAGTFTVLANQSHLPSLSQIPYPHYYYADTPTTDGSWQLRWVALLLVRSFP
jgi:hypothetical protein